MPDEASSAHVRAAPPASARQHIHVPRCCTKYPARVIFRSRPHVRLDIHQLQLHCHLQHTIITSTGSISACKAPMTQC